jgi:hypothetical protein
MKNRSIVVLIAVIFASSCSHTQNHPVNCDVAVKFINDYYDYTDKHPNKADSWIAESDLVTERFKMRYKRIIDSAWEKEPNVGLDFDPIFDSNGLFGKVELVDCDTKNGYVLVRISDAPEHKLTLRLVHEGSRDMIDGAGIINIPESKQINR